MLLHALCAHAVAALLHPQIYQLHVRCRCYKLTHDALLLLLPSDPAG
jgi:hypothetical protein